MMGLAMELKRDDMIGDDMIGNGNETKRFQKKSYGAEEKRIELL